jgi:hypothetical protein
MFVQERPPQYPIRTGVKGLLIVIGSLLLRLATVSLPPVARDYYTECIVIFGKGLPRSSRERVYG